MIYTVTFNPAIDYVMHINTFAPGATNRSICEEIYFGGKGINVSLVLNELGLKTTAFGFVAGFTGNAIEQYLNSVGVKSDFVHLDNGFSRINVKLKNIKETEINGCGPGIDNNKLNEFMQKIKNIKSGDTLVLAGSIPSSLPDNIYETIIKNLPCNNVKIVVDATGELLKNTLKYKPYLIKPNKAELEELFCKKLVSKKDIQDCAAILQKMGAENVLVSMGADGAILLDSSGNFHTHSAAGGVLINSVGAGDSMVAGFLAGTDKGYEYALKLAISSGSATAFSKALATKTEIENIFNSLSDNLINTATE